jgi:hypothetical protein
VEALPIGNRQYAIGPMLVTFAYCPLLIADCSKKNVIFFHNKILAIKPLDNWTIDVTS